MAKLLSTVPELSPPLSRLQGPTGKGRPVTSLALLLLRILVLPSLPHLQLEGLEERRQDTELWAGRRESRGPEQAHH